ALAIAEYSGQLFPALAGRERERLVGLAVLLGVLLPQWYGVRVGSHFQNWTSAIKALAFLALIACCLFLGGQPSSPTPRPVPSGFALAAAVVIAMQGVMFTYSGWEIASYFGEEVRDPGRTLPRAMIGGTLIVIVIFLLYNLALLSVLSLP